MSLPFFLTAMSRLDGSAEDGIHLLWTAPQAIGYSIDGYDIQRRDAKDRGRPSCYTLADSELEMLHRTARLEYRFGTIGVQLTKCPEFPTVAPDAPFQITIGRAQETVFDFSRTAIDKKANPRKEPGIQFLVRDRAGKPDNFTRIRSTGVHTGLDCGFELEITLLNPSAAVELELVHSAEAPIVEALNAAGREVDKAFVKASPGQAQTVVLRGTAIQRLVIRAPQSEVLLLRVAFQPRNDTSLPEPPYDQDSTTGNRDLSIGTPSRFDRPAVDWKQATAAAGAPRSAAAVQHLSLTTLPTNCFYYDLRFFGSHDHVRVTIGVPLVLAIAMREDKAVATDMQSVAGGVQVVNFFGREIDRLLLYVKHAANTLIVCVNDLLTLEQEEEEWRLAPFLGKGIQLPIRQINRALASPADENALAQSRLLPGETFVAADFEEVAEVMNATAVLSNEISPVRFTTVTRERSEDPLIELRPWPYAFSLLTDPAWRRMLGFAFFDKTGLTPGQVYDYRLTGRFRRRDLEEICCGFHTIPIGTTLPRRFRLHSILLDTFQPSLVSIEPAPAEDVLDAVGLKGIALGPSQAGGASISITYPTPVRRAILEFLPGQNHALSFRAKTSDYIAGLSGQTFTGSVPAQRRVVLNFAEPIDTLVLSGTGFLCGIRIAHPLAVGGNPEDILRRSVILRGVVFEATPPPPSPPFLGTTNLQDFQLPGDPAITTQHPPNQIGYRLLWLPPPSTQLVPWPPELGAFPPFDVVSFALERSRTDTAGPFEEIEAKTLFFGSRGARRQPPQLYPGIDLLKLFPEVATPEPPVSLFMETEDVLQSPSRSGPPPGSFHQYRIFSVDAIGRRSTLPTLGSVVRLEKRVPPPQPVGPTTPVPAGAIRPSGVRARVLQSIDPELTDSDRLLLGTSTNAVVLEWAWTQDERNRDPFATEFRVYWQPVPPDMVRGTLIGPVITTVNLFEMRAELNQSIAADALKGRFLTAGTYPFKVVTNDAGAAITIRFHRPLLNDTAVPAESVFEAPLIVSGSVLRPPAWLERSAVIPISAAENYQFVFRDRLVIDANQPAIRVWTGVSAADDQSYVDDELDDDQPNGGRPGNESSIAAVSVEARYLGRPEFTVPPPLPDVPEQVTNEPVADSVSVTLDLPALLSGINIPAGHRLSLERVSAGALLAGMSAQADNSIGAKFPNGTTTTYALANPTDQETLLAQIRSSEPATVEGRFVMDFLGRHLAALEPLWQPALPNPIIVAAVDDTLPAKAERYIHRVKLVDAAGHISSGGAIVPQFVRVPSMRSPATPAFDLPSASGSRLTFSARVHDAFDLRWLVFFLLVSDATAPADSRSLETPQLLRLPNRRDLYPNHGIRLRLKDGSLLAPTPLDVATGSVEVPDRLLNVPIVVGFEKRVSVWAISMTRDGITSRLAGPRTGFTGPEPLSVLDLSVTIGNRADLASWTTAPSGSQVALERSLDNGVTWQRVSPLLPQTVTSFEVPQTTASRVYRLVVKADRDRVVNGSAVVPS